MVDRSTGKKSTRRRVASQSAGLRVHRFAGVALGGGKTERTSVAVIEYYPDSKRVFLRALRDKIKTEGLISSDEALHHLLTVEEVGLETIAFDAPLQLPKCIRCELVCPGFEACRLPEIRWLWNEHDLREKKKRPNKVFTPYTERCAEVAIANHLEEPFHPPHVLGANAAPLAARAHFLARRITGKRTLNLAKPESTDPQLIEVFPKLSVWRIGRDLKVPKSHLRFHRHAVDSDESRMYFLKQLIEREIAFIYQQDLKTLVESPQAFDAFVASLTAFLKYRGQTAPRPPGFPKDEIWIEYPEEQIDWF
jgi:hypothetical protein